MKQQQQQQQQNEIILRSYFYRVPMVVLHCLMIDYFLKNLHTYEIKVKHYSMERRKDELLCSKRMIEVIDRMSAMKEIARNLLSSHFQIYGGFIRDYLIDNKEANDIDFLADNLNDLYLHINTHLKQFSSKNSLKMEIKPPESLQYGERVEIIFNSPLFSYPIKCDAMILRKKPKICDADVNNLLLDSRGNLKQKIETSYYTVEESIHNILKKSFHFFMGWEDDLYSRDRICKLLKKNYHCKSGVTNDKINLFPADLISRISI